MATEVHGPRFRLVFGCFLAAAFLGCLVSRVYWQLGWGLGWKTSQFFFNYQELGFVKRAAIGTLLHPFPALLSGPMLFAASAAVLVLLIAVFSFVFCGAVRTLAPSARGTLLAVFAASPALFLHFGFDIGRYDILGLLIAIGSIRAIQSGSWRTAGLVSASALLAHEAYLVINFPLVVAFAWTLRPRNGFRWADWAWLTIPSIVVAAVISRHGNYEPGLEALTKLFADDAVYVAATKDQPARINTDAVAVLTRTLSDNVAYMEKGFWEWKAYLHFPIALLWGSILTWFVCRFYQLNNRSPGFLFYACFGPLILSAIAADHCRWVALVATNMLLVILLELARLVREGVQPRIPSGVVVALLILSGLLGPIGDLKAFPMPPIVLRLLVG